jgi:putative membrane protein (TIGR04086 family)
MKLPLGRILFIGFAFEILFLVALIVVVQGMLKYSLVGIELTLALFVGVLFCGFWLGKKTPSNEIRNGTLIGLVTVLVYILISISAELAGAIRINYDFYYFLNHLAKVLGGTLGGLIALNLSKRQSSTEMKYQ